MKLFIVLSAAEAVPQESELLNKMFENGLQLLHLRKPDWSKVDYEALLQSIAPAHKRKVVLHHYHELAAKYYVGGLHLRESARRQLSEVQLAQLVKEIKRKGLSISTSMHSLEEAAQFGGLFDYVFASPVFDSISKQGHMANPIWLKAPLGDLKENVVALGGIDASTLPQALALGFAGVAVLGAVWQSFDPVAACIKMQKMLT